MKHLPLLYSLATLLLFTACAGSNAPTSEKPAAPNLVQPQGDEEEYELIIMDTGYSSWFAANALPIHHYSAQYYKNWNDRYVRSWNELADRPRTRRGLDYPFENRINYDPAENYDLQLHYELFWYFRYVESVWGRYYNFPN